MFQHPLTRATNAFVAVALLLTLVGCSRGETAAVVTTGSGITPPAVATTASALAHSPSSVPSLSRTVSGPKEIDDAFLKSWKTFFPNQGDDLAIVQALNICDSFKVGKTYAEQVQTLQANGSVSRGDATYMIGSAIIAYCPEFSGQMSG